MKEGLENVLEAEHNLVVCFGKEARMIPINYLSKLERIRLYSRVKFDFLNMEAVFSDETKLFVSNNEPLSGERLRIRLRTAKNNVDSVTLLLAEPTKETLVAMKKEEDQGSVLFDYYYAETEIAAQLHYYFCITKNDRTYFYNKKGVSQNPDPNFHFHLIADFKTPDWAKGAVMYQIYVDRFYNGDPSNDVVQNEYAYLGRAAKKVENWYAEPATDDICNFYGGDLKGVMDKLAYLKDLGVQAIYLNPIFVSPSNHKYDIQDYDYVDPHIGEIVTDGGDPLYFENFKNTHATKYMKRTTAKENLEASNALLAKLIDLAHQNGIKVILDGVFNHCGAFNKWLDREGFYEKNGYPKGAYTSESSPYNSFFFWNGNFWPDNFAYDCWWGHDNHPKLNYEDSPQLFDYMMKIAQKWVSPPFNADGWRLDVAADLGYSKEFNHKFWKSFRKAVKEAKPDAIILAEHYGDPQDWLQGDQWDTIMNYDAFMEPITWFLTGMEKHSEDFKGELLSNAQAFRAAMLYHRNRMSIQSQQTSMNQLSNHDHSRFLTRTNMTVGRLHTKGSEAAGENLNLGIMMEGILFQMTWIGAPTVYYGDEAGVFGWTDPDNRRSYPWGQENKTLIAFHKALIDLRKTHSALRTGSTEFLVLEHGLLAFARWDEAEHFVVILNNNPNEVSVSIPVWRIDLLDTPMARVISSSMDGFKVYLDLKPCGSTSIHAAEKVPVENGLAMLTMDGYSGMVLKGLMNKDC